MLKMGRVKKKHALWMKSGGLARLIDKFDSVNIRMKKTDWSSEVWSELSTAVFGVNNYHNRKWLHVVWTQNRRGLRTRVMKPKTYDDKNSDVKSMDHPSPVGLTDSDGERGDAPKPADHPSPVGLTDSDGERGEAPKPADHPSPVGLTDSDGERGEAPKPADHPSPVGLTDSDGERGDAPKPADHPSPVGLTDSDGERGDAPKPADHPSPVGLTDSDGERGEAPKPADHPSPVGLTDSDGERGDAPKPADHPSPVWLTDSDGERGDAPKPADHPSPVGLTDSDGERGEAPKPADHPSPVGLTDSDGERGDAPKPADHPSPVGLTDSDGERGDAPKPADHPSPVGLTDSDGERGDAPKPADHPSPVGLTDSDGERGDAPKPADHPSPVGLTDSDGERGDAPKPADHPSPVGLTDSDGERGEAPKQQQHQKITYRTTRPGPKCFTVYISARKWKKIRPLPGSRKLKTSWTHIIYEKFRKQNPCCTLVFTYQHLKVARSRKYRCPFMTVKASCSFKSCNAHYVFQIRQKPLSSDKRIPVTVTRIGKVTHSKEEVGSRPASYQKRGKIAKEVFKGVSNVYYRNLRKTPIPELMAGNISRSLSKNILKVISSEVRKSCRLHDDVILELMLTQKIIRDTDQSYRFCPGYVQHLQVDPFGVHLYTETGLVILIQHLRKGCPVTLHLDATGGVVSRIPSQAKRVLYYSITLPGHGKDKPPLPISEMVTNDHTIPNVSFWLHQTVTKIRKLTTYNIQQVETDYSWALIQSVLLSFNKEDIHMYLMECYKLVKGNDTITDFSRQTVLHLCSAHIIKAVQGAIGKKTTDKGLKEFATHCVAQLINTTSLKRAVEIFKCMCHVFYTKQHTKCVNQCLKQLHDHISGIKIPEDTLDVKPPVDDYIPPEAKTILARSPFTREFDSVLDTVICNEDQEEETEIGNNKYHCPGILDFLMKDYMPIFPLWSGIMLGDLTRHNAKESRDDDELQKTHDTNCHAENWFCIVKDKILQKKLHHRPATFIQKMYASLQGRYREHILQHNLPDRILQKCFSVKKGRLEDSEEKWAKKSVCDRKGNKTKYFHTPDVIPSPKAKSTKPSVGHPKSSKEGDCVKIESKISQEAKASVRQRKSRSTKPHHVKGVSKTSQASEAQTKTKNKETGSVEVVSDTSQESKASVWQQRSRRIKPHHVKGASKTSQAAKAQPKNKIKGTDRVEVVSDTSQESKASVTKHKGKKEKTDTEATTQACQDDIVQASWNSKDSEVVVAVVQSLDTDAVYTLHITDFKSLKPHNWLNGEVIECYFQTLLNSKDCGRKIFLFNHYYAGVVVFGERSAMSNYSYKKVNFENYDAIIGFMQVHSNHWKFLYLNRTLQKAFVVDPQGNDEEKDSELAAKRFRQYFKMQQIVLNKTDWVDVKWTTGLLTHNIQKDGCSCGVYVMQMAKETVEAFPMTPSEIVIPSNKRLLSELRKEMAVTILESSGKVPKETDSVSAEELDWSAESHIINPAEHLWCDSKRRHLNRLITKHQ